MTPDPAAANPTPEGAGRHRVVFTPSGLNGEVAAGSTVLEAARQLGVDLDSVCGGRGICGRCQVVPGEGEFPKWSITTSAAHLQDPDHLEASYRGKRPLTDGRRLGCAVRLVGDAVIDVPAESQIHRQVVRKDIDLGDLVLAPGITLRYVALEIGPEDDRSAVALLRDGLAESFGLTVDRVSAPVLERLHAAVADPSAGATVALRDRDGSVLVGAWSGFSDRVVGAAIDVGSTTIAGHLCDLSTGEVLASAGRMNPQIRFGEDLMSRVSYAMMNPGGAAALTGAVREALQQLIDELLATAAVDADRLLDLVLVGNPIMHHLLLGIDPTPLGQAPFRLAVSDAVHTHASALGLSFPLCDVYVAPCIAGHVGADTAAAILSEGPHRSDRVQLLVDVGTNAEIVLGHAGALYAASSPTGPAFEGAQISAGQRATTGAIERVRIDRDTLEPRIRVIGCELWSDDPDFAQRTAEIPITGICGSGIIEVVSELFLAGVIDAQGVIRPEAAERTDRVVAEDRTFSYVLHRGASELRVTQADIRAIQLAKAALRAGIDLLRERSGFAHIDEVRLAGAFGAHIDPLHAMVLGLIPDGPLASVRAVGNAAGSGAVRALLSTDQRAEMERVVAEVTKIETATEPRFQALFVAALAFPHQDAPTDQLGRAVVLPPRGPVTDRPTRRRRARGAGPETSPSVVTRP
jgi:uncharacterized 2Fe-2S/4Fe-4S cluster protein (DUF4445 family)